MLRLVGLLLLAAAVLVTAQEYKYTLNKKTNNGVTGEAALVGRYIWFFAILFFSGPYGNDISTIKFDIFFEDANRVRIRILDANNARWQVPNIIQSSTPDVAPAQVKLIFFNFLK